MKLLTFRINGKPYGIDSGRVREIGRDILFTPVPAAASCIVGLCGIHGRVVTVFDASEMLGHPPVRRDIPLHCVILTAGPEDKDTAGFTVDTADGIFFMNMPNPEAEVHVIDSALFTRFPHTQNVS